MDEHKSFFLTKQSAHITTADIGRYRASVSYKLITLFPYIGFLLGIVMWLADAAIDVLLINPDEEFLASVFSEEPTEIWMRTLVIVVLVTSSLFARNFMRKQYEFEIVMHKYHDHLEQIVDERTKELQCLASIDALTQIYNRYKFDQLLALEVERARRYQQPLSLVILDIDHFKSVNDQYGHDEGDRILQIVADVLRKNLRQSDIYARWGGEEFVLLMAHTNLQEAENMAEKIRQLFSAVTYGNNQPLTASFGVSQLHTEEDSDSLIKSADDALYKAKRSGRNRICVMK